MAQKTAALIGATGLVGSCILKYLEQDDTYATVRVLVRRPVSFSHPKLEIKLVNFEDEESFKLAIDGSDAVFCAIGTTNKKVKGDKAAYRKIDYDIPVNAARFCKETGCNIFMLVSAVGANNKSGNFYLKLKGEVEEVIQKLSIGSIGFFRPSLITGDRKEFRLAEKIAKPIASFSPSF